jgi:hypothetical protein
MEIKTEPGIVQKNTSSAPLDFLKALFEVSPSDEESSEDEEPMALATKTATQNNQSVTNPPKTPIKVEMDTRTEAKTPREKVFTVLDAIDDDDVYGPALPPQEVLSSAGNGLTKYKRPKRSKIECPQIIMHNNFYYRPNTKYILRCIRGHTSQNEKAS